MREILFPAWNSPISWSQRYVRKTSILLAKRLWLRQEPTQLKQEHQEHNEERQWGIMKLMEFREDWALFNANQLKISSSYNHNFVWFNRCWIADSSHRGDGFVFFFSDFEIIWQWSWRQKETNAFNSGWISNIKINSLIATIKYPTSNHQNRIAYKVHLEYLAFAAYYEAALYSKRKRPSLENSNALFHPIAALLWSHPTSDCFLALTWVGSSYLPYRLFSWLMLTIL